MQKIRIAIFASGTGSNAMNLIRTYSQSNEIEVAFVLSNNSKAKILDSAPKENIKTFCFTNEQVADGDFLTSLCKEEKVDWIVLAGYLRLIPQQLISVYSDKIINLHPSILPKYGGKGMYGRRVHEAVIEANESESGITVHLVNEEFDKGRKLAQFYCAIDDSDTVEILEQKIHQLEQKYLPTVVRNTII